MSSAMTNFLIAVGITSAIAYALMTHVQNRSRRRSRAGATADGGGSSGSNDGFMFGNWFSSDHSPLDSSGNPTDGASCSFGSDGGGGDCGGGGDGGGGGD